MIKNTLKASNLTSLDTKLQDACLMQIQQCVHTFAYASHNAHDRSVAHMQSKLLIHYAIQTHITDTSYQTLTGQVKPSRTPAARLT